MSRRPRSKSQWNKILIMDAGQEVKAFDLDDLGRLKQKIKTQKRRKIHEGRQARRIPDHSNQSIPKANDEINNQSHSFDLDDLHDQTNSLFDNFQDFSEITNDINKESDFNEQILYNETDFYNVNEINFSIFDL